MPRLGHYIPAPVTPATLRQSPYSTPRDRADFLNQAIGLEAGVSARCFRFASHFLRAFASLRETFDGLLRPWLVQKHIIYEQLRSLR
jgi:hypothetical protein